MQRFLAPHEFAVHAGGIRLVLCTPNRTSSDCPTHGCTRYVYQLAAIPVTLNYLRHTNNGIACPAENDIP